MSEHILEVRSLQKSFGAHEVLKNITFSVEAGEVICIIGSSGSGKSTLLRCINYLEEPTAGDILFHGKNVEKEFRIVRRGKNKTAYILGHHTHA